jgi:hypothetical protein
MRQGVLMAVLIAVMAALGCIAYTNAATDTSPRPGSYRAAVLRVLDERRVDYHDVEVLDSCAPSYQLCRTYAGTVRVLAATAILGRIECRERWITCTLTIPQAGIRSAPLDDTIDPLAARWEAIYGQLILRFHAIYHTKSDHTNPHNSVLE